MAYNYTYINKLQQFKYTSYTLVLEDEDGVMPTIRNEKCFIEAKYPNLTDQILDDEANIDIQIYTQKFQDEYVPSEEDMPSDDDEDIKPEDYKIDPALVIDLQNAAKSKDPQVILDKLYSILKGNDKIAIPLLSVLEDAEVVKTVK